jgi:hypothetical protein
MKHLSRFALHTALFIVSSWFVFTYLRREHLTPAQETEKKIKKLETEYSKLRADFDSQESRMGSAATEAAQKQALLRSHTTG